MTDTLVSKIAAAAIDVGGKLGTDKRNQEQRYDYVSADKILSVCGQALFTQGVVVAPEIVEQTVNPVEYVNSRGATGKRYDCAASYVFHVSDGEQTQSYKWVGMGSDYSVPDKALYKAITTGHKYFLMKLLCIGAGNEDAEHEEEPKEEVRPARQPVTRQATTEELEPAAMSLESASEVLNSAGEKYITLDSEKLSMMTIGINKGLEKKDITQEQRDEYNYKLDAIRTILASRQ